MCLGKQKWYLKIFESEIFDFQVMMVQNIVPEPLNTLYWPLLLSGETGLYLPQQTKKENYPCLEGLSVQCKGNRYRASISRCAELFDVFCLKCSIDLHSIGGR